jgi:uncharacterized protein (TIRG00374 family)
MSETHFVRRNWKLIINIITVLALVVLIVALREQLVETFSNLAKIHAWVLLLLLPLQWLNYHAQTKMYQGLFALVGNKLRYKFLFRTSLELNFVNQVFPSGGVTGISYFGMRLRNKEITAGKATLVQIIKLGLLFLSFEILLVLGLFFLAIGNQANDVIILVTSSISTLMIVGTIAFAMIIGSERRIKGTFKAITMFLNRVIHLVRPKHPETINIDRIERGVMELHNNYRLLTSSYRRLRGPFLWALMVNVTEVLKIYVVYLAFGNAVNLGAVILAYSVANFAGLVSVMPGGIGIYEALMTAVLTAAGVPAKLSIPVTIMYRVLSTLIQLPPGYYFYQKTIRGNKDAEAKMKEMHGDQHDG